MKPVIRIDGKPVEPLANANIVEVEPGGVYSLILVDGARRTKCGLVAATLP